MFGIWLLCQLARSLQLNLPASGFSGNSSRNSSELVRAHEAFQISGEASKRTSVFTSFGAVGEFTPMKKEQCDIARQYAATPTFCTTGSGRFGDLAPSIPGFAQLWAQMKTAFVGAPCCMGINHLFAVYHTVLTLKPPVIIESGVAAGHTTWLLRKVAPAALIFSLDPTGPASYQLQYQGIQGYFDPVGTTYLTGALFQDLSAARWDQLIPDPAVRAKTLVILDDHQSTIERVNMLRRWGFVYIFYEDNYPFGVATSHDRFTCPLLTTIQRTFTKTLFGDAYSPNTMCGPLPAGTTEVLLKDRFGKECKLLTVAQHKANVASFQGVLDWYFEYPALFRDCPGAKRPALITDVAQLALLGLPTETEEIWGYGHLHPPLMHLKPVPPANALAELQTAIQLAVKFTQDAARGAQLV
jgi:hypothetical protein